MVSDATKAGVSGNGWVLFSGGYPGLASTARQIADYIPRSKLYVEPFAGMGRLCRFLCPSRAVLNDRSDFAVNHLRRRFSHHLVTQMDFVECINTFDETDTFFFIDPPWRDEVYGNIDEPFIDRPSERYYVELLEILPHIKGDWMLCSGGNDSSAGYDLWQNTGFFKLALESKNFILYGKKARVCLYSNKPFSSRQLTLQD